MDVRVCRSCKKMFQHVAGPDICPRCKQKEEDMFVVVKDYLRENPGASMVQVSTETDVPASLIEKFLRQGRLEVTPDSPIGLTCEICGRKISSGRYCSECNNSLKNELHQVRKDLMGNIQNNEPKNSNDARAKMRYFESDKLRH